MPLMTQIMKKCECEAQQKIAEAQKINKENRPQYDSENDGGEVLHDPKAAEEKEEKVEIDLEKELKENEGLEKSSQVNIDPEDILSQKSNIKELYLSVLKLNKALERVKEYPELLEEVERLREENQQLKKQGGSRRSPAKKVEPLLPR